MAKGQIATKLFPADGTDDVVPIKTYDGDGNCFFLAVKQGQSGEQTEGT